MGQEELIFNFEKKYPFLYEVTAGGVPIYTSLRDTTQQLLRDGKEAVNTAGQEEKGKISFKRIKVGFFKKKKYKKYETLIFTSTVYRRDKGRNLAAEFLIDKYKNAVVFEWPSRNEAFDNGYFSDPNKDKYCPLDWFSVKTKIYYLLHKKEYKKLYKECSDKILPLFNAQKIDSENEKKAVDYLKSQLPDSYARTIINQKLAEKYFKKFKNVKYAIDFWGGARENIIPALKGNPESIELQHGIIMSYHTGYIYPEFVGENKLDFFKRRILVYGDATKKLLVENSIFKEDRIEVVGNPRVKMYKKVFPIEKAESKLIFFASQSYEQDGTGVGYYDTAIKILKKVSEQIKTDDYWKGFKLGVKLHPRESQKAIELYKNAIPELEVFGNTSQLFEIINSAYLQLTVSSTTLYEAAEFDTPTVSVQYSDFTPIATYGFETLLMKDDDSVVEIMNKFKDKNEYNEYLKYLKEKTKQYM